MRRGPLTHLEAPGWCGERADSSHQRPGPLPGLDMRPWRMFQFPPAKSSLQVSVKLEPKDALAGYFSFIIPKAISDKSAPQQGVLIITSLQGNIRAAARPLLIFSSSTFEATSSLMLLWTCH